MNIIYETPQINSLIIELLYEDIYRRIDLTWTDIKFAVEQGFFSYKIAIDHATNLFKRFGYRNEIETKLACMFKFESYCHEIMDLVLRLVEFENVDIAETKDKFFYLSLDWVYNNRHKLNNPLILVEWIWMDAEYDHVVDDVPPLVHWKRYLDMQYEKYKRIN